MADDPFDPWLEPSSKTAEMKIAPGWRRFWWVILISGVLSCLAWTFAHRNDPKIVNYLVNCFPVPLTIFIAFMPDLRRAHVVWRIMIVIFGIAWSFLLWRQMDLSAKQAIQDQEGIVTAAVTHANSHSDAKFSQMKQQVDQTGSEIGNRLNKVEADLASSIGKVGKPEPPERPKFTFSFWRDGMTGDEFPIDSETLSPDSKGNFKIEFAFRNDSSVSAEGIEEWVQICDECSFVGEPKGFDRPEGTDSHTRHRLISDLNAGVTLVEGNEFEVKPPNQFMKFSMIFKITCKTCGQLQMTKQFWVTPTTLMPIPSGSISN